jgi:hypothetical protein
VDLSFRTDGSFHIVQFTDLHWHNDDPRDAPTGRLMVDVLDAEAPDLVLLTGDVIAGRACSDPASAWREAVAPIVERGLPWAAVFGNHDDEGSLTREDLLAVQQGIPGCLSEHGPEGLSGVGNYVLPIRDGASGEIGALLFCLDSGGYADETIGGYAWVGQDQVAWYRETARTLAGGVGRAPLPTLVFLHIPLPEYAEVWDTRVCYGHRYEPVCCPRVNSGLFVALYEAGDVLGVFAGHDHVNDYEGTLHGIRLCYGRAGGYHTYGREGFPRGARVIALRRGERTFRTWLRLAGGQRVDAQPPHDPETKE